MSPARMVSRIEPPTAGPDTVTTQGLMAEVGCTHREIDYWVRLGLIDVAEGEPQPGSGYQRRFSRQAVFLAKVVRCLRGFGFQGEPLSRAIGEIREHSPAARLVYVKQDGSTDWGPGVPAAIVIDLDQFRLKSTTEGADR